MSAEHAGPLSFVCPQCQKRLKAPASLAGQRLKCPNCTSMIRVPGVAPATKDDDEWLSLDTPATPTQPAQPTSTPKAKPVASPAQAVHAQPKHETTVAASHGNDVNDEYRLAPHHDASVPAATEITPSPVTGVSSGDVPASGIKRSVFDDDLPDLTPLEEAAYPPQQAYDVFPPPTQPVQSRAPAADATKRRAFGGSSKSTSNANNGASKTPAANKPASNSEPPKPKPAPVSTNPFGDELAGIDLPDIPLPDNARPERATDRSQQSNANKKTASTTKGPLLVGSLEELSLGAPALDASFEIPKDDEFRFPCKVCGTFLYARESRIGTMTRCPDCFSEFTIPTPTKKKKTELKLDETAADVTFAPIDAKSVRAELPDSMKTKAILEKAAVDLEQEKKETDPVNATFDSKRWLGLIFGFFRDPGLIAAAVILGFISGLWFLGMAAPGTVIKMDPTQAIVLRILLFLVFCIPVLGSIAMCALVIIPMAANRASRVEEWPFSKIGESMGELTMLIVAIIVGSIPGGMLATLLSLLGSHPAVAAGSIMFTIWLITPFILLSIIDTGSIFEPYSKQVQQSISLKGDAWGAMYMQSALAMLFLFAFIAVASTGSLASNFVLGALLPFFAFFIANQYGVLAGRISSVTQLGFEGDFSDDE